VFLKGAGGFGELHPLEYDIVVEGKSDLREDGLGVSGVTGAGVSRLIEDVKTYLLRQATSAGLVSHERQRDVLVAARECLFSALSFSRSGPGTYDLASEELRSAIFTLERLVGRVDVEDVLDKVFSSFCIGK
jgi:tRNA modification GTPase